MKELQQKLCSEMKVKIVTFPIIVRVVAKFVQNDM